MNKQQKLPFNACIKSLNELRRIESENKVDIHKMLVASLTLHKTVEKYTQNRIKNSPNRGINYGVHRRRTRIMSK